MRILILYLLVAFLPSFCISQDVAELAYRARVSLYDNWDFEKTDYYFKKVIGKKYAPAFAYSDYGWYIMLDGEYEEGLAFIDKAAKMDPKDKQLLTWNAWAMLWDKNVRNADIEIKAALALDPKYGEALYVRSMIYSEMNQHEKAIQAANKAAKFDQNYRAVIPYALAKAGRREEALKEANRIGNSANAFDAMLLVEAYAVMGKDEVAMKFLEKAFELKHPFMPWIFFIPSIKHLHEHEKFKEIARKLKLL